MYYPIDYDEPVFRPPSEANSVILQVTLGCSWNRCAFCEMYRSKKFSIKKPEQVKEEIIRVSREFPDVRKIFLADGNALVLPFDQLSDILDWIRRYFPRVRRVSAYALPGDLLRKSPEALKKLKEKGLSLVYVGIETGDEELLRLINKNETFATTAEGLLKAQDAGIKSSVMILNGLGGERYSRQHSMQSARLVNLVQPAFLSTLVLSFPYGEEHYRTRFRGEFNPLDTDGLLQELYDFIDSTELENTVFRSDHASNYLPLKGMLGRDKQRLLKLIHTAIHHPEAVRLRPEWLRGL
ncbi:MAG: radical SAM protein [Bacteroidales bacterium]